MSGNLGPNRSYVRLLKISLPVVLLGLAAGVARAEVTAEDRALVEEVKRSLLAKITQPPPGYEWPPSVAIFDDANINSGAKLHTETDGSRAKLYPQICIYAGLLHRAIRTKNDSDPEAATDRLAFVLGHELGHILLRHCEEGGSKKTLFAEHAFSRDQEFAADQKGMELALKVGYRYPKMLALVERLIDLEPPSLELAKDHPSWTERRARLEKDEQQASLWRASGSFADGGLFLAWEQYAAAEHCFLRVIKDFPKCHEAWANLGYARLMRYCDALDAKELRQFSVGQIVVAGFCSQPHALQFTRGINNELWADAVAALCQAIQLKSDLALPRINLGVAYLVHPGGKPDHQQAAKYLREAAAKADADPSLGAVARAALLVNSGIAEFGCGCTDKSMQDFDRGEQLSQQLASQRQPLPPKLSSALYYNRAQVLAASPDPEKRRRAITELENYLRIADPQSAGWPPALQQYKGLCQLAKKL